jgi:phospholipase C
MPPTGRKRRTDGAKSKTRPRSSGGATSKTRRAATPRQTYVAAAADDTVANLDKIEHIVVLMLENRSFDHMLGYLSLEAGRLDVDGLKAGMSNTYRGKKYPIRHLQRTALTKPEDPCHGGACTAEQVAGGMGGFVANYAKSRPQAPHVDLVMGYYTGADLPTYDHLAREFCICDRWFSSVPGATWPNRLYAVAGRAAGSKDGKKVPIYDVPSFVRQLDASRVSWRWYAHDVATLRFSDGNYLLADGSHFAYFDQKSILAPRNFIDDARDGKLPALSWIDPNFYDVTFTGPSGSNDDHPPSDVHAGQELVLKTYTALLNSPNWSRTLLIITYDEHGGFYDHVPPPAAQDDSAAFRTYGVRVPAIVVSPCVERQSVSNLLFDHTSIIKTILLKFCRRNDGQIPDLGARVNHANHLGSLLSLDAARKPTTPAAYQHAVDQITTWRAQVLRSRLMMEPEPITQSADPTDLTDLQREYLKAKAAVRSQGLPEGQP